MNRLGSADGKLRGDAAPLYEARGLSFSYDRKPALRSVSAVIEAGSSAALTGPNGSGKTTFLKLLAGLVGPYRGSLLFMGRELSEARGLRGKAMYLHQHPVMFRGSVRDNIAYPLRLRRVARDEAAARAEALAAEFGLSGLLDRQANRLSGGETQRVALVRALITGAKTLLLDEPTSSMDAGSVALVTEALAALKARGLNLIFSAHDEELVRALADRELRFSAGALEEER